MKPNLRLKHERERRGWSQAKVAQELGTDPLTVSRWERGVSMPYPYFREQLCALFGKTVEELGLLAREDSVADEAVSGEPGTPVLDQQDQQTEQPSREPQVQDPSVPFLLENTVDLVGRTVLLEHLKQRLCSEHPPAMLALHGLPGVGKTALAVALVHDPHIQQHFCDGILWASLGPNPNISGLLSRWGKLLGIAGVGKETGLAEWGWAYALRAAIDNRRMFLVIDDAWQAEAALAFQVGGPQCVHLLTTRFPPLAFSFAAEEAILVPELTEQEGVELLARFAPQVIAHDPKQARMLVHSVGALPLALTLMGKYLRVVSSAGQPRRLETAINRLRDAEQRLQLAANVATLARPPSLAEGMNISLQAVIDVSHQQLDEPSRAALYALSAFPAKPHSFSEEAALWVAQTPVETLDTLSDAGLLENSGPGRYCLHQTVADYARVHLKGTQAHERLVAYGVRYAQAHRTDEEALERESYALLAALQAADELGLQQDLIQGICTLAPFLYVRGSYVLSAKYLQQAHQAAIDLGDRSSLGSILLYLGQIQLQWGDLAQSEASLQEGLGLARDMGDEELMCGLLTELGWLASAQGNFEQAEIACQQGLVLARRLRDQERICNLLIVLAWGNFERKNDAEAISFAREALALARQHHIRYWAPFALAILGWVATRKGNYEQATTYYQEGLAEADQMHHIFASSMVLRGQGWLEEKLGDDVQARAYYQEALTISRQLHQHESIYRLLISLGQVEEKLGNDVQAEADYQEALRFARRNHGKPRVIGILLARLGSLLLRKQQDEAAQATFREILNMQASVPVYLQARAQYGLALLAAEQGDIDEARRLGEMSLANFEAAGHSTAEEVRDWLKQLP